MLRVTRRLVRAQVVLESDMKPSMAHRMLAELTGTGFLVLTGCGAIVVDQQTAMLGQAGIACAFGLVVLVMVLATGHISGAHLNPAVTLALCSLRRIEPRAAGLYMVAQLAGATMAGLVLGTLFPAAVRGGLGATVPAGPVGQSLGLEIVLTAILMFVIASVATDARATRQTAPFAIGGTVALGALWGGPISGASMNPARSFGPALVSDHWQHHWLYWLGPIVGALVGGWLYECLRKREQA